MAKFRSIKNSFIAGEVSPTAMGRTDLPQYVHACKLLRNMIPHLSGGTYRRPGTLFDRKFLANDYTYPRLIPFVVSQTESYVIALNRAFAGSGIVTAFRATNTFSPSTTATVTGGTSYAFDNATLREETDAIQYSQSVDVMTLVHPNHKPLTVTRTAVDAFTVADFDAGLSADALRDAWPYRNSNKTATTITPSATSGSGITLTASTAIFSSGHVGALFKIKHGGVIGCAQITAYTDSTHVTATVIVTFGATTSQSTWWESAWSNYRGWPRTVAQFRQRICYGGNATDRDSIWFSFSNNYRQLSVDALIVVNSSGDGVSTGPTGEQPFTIEMSSNQLNLIQWMSPDKTLAAGTLGDEYIIDTDGSGGGFSASTAKVTPQSHFGSSYHMAVRAGSELIFANQANDKISALVFNVIQDTYTSQPLQTLFSEFPRPAAGSLRKRFVSYSWDESRKTMWCLDMAGNLSGMTRDTTLQVTAWHTHQFGGYDPSKNALGLCAGSVVSVAAAPNPILGVNDIWITVIRNINGVDQYHIERFMGKGITSDTAASSMLAIAGNYFTDATVYDANGIALTLPEDHISDGLYVDYSHLEGEVVTGTADSSLGIFDLSESTVASAVVPLATPYPPDYDTIAYNTAIGLAFDSIIIPVRIEAGSQIGSAQGAIKRIHKATVRFHKTLSAKIGASEDLLETIVFREGSTPMNQSPELFTGDKAVDLEGDYDRDGYVYLLQDRPLPFSVISIISEGETYD